MNTYTINTQQMGAVWIGIDPVRGISVIAKTEADAIKGVAYAITTYLVPKSTREISQEMDHSENFKRLVKEAQQKAEDEQKEKRRWGIKPMPTWSLEDISKIGYEPYRCSCGFPLAFRYPVENDCTATALCGACGKRHTRTGAELNSFQPVYMPLPPKT